MKSKRLVDILAPQPADPPAPSPWRSTPNAKRRAKARNLTLTPEAHAALDDAAEAHHGGNASEAASAAIVAYAAAKAG